MAKFRSGVRAVQLVGRASKYNLRMYEMIFIDWHCFWMKNIKEKLYNFGKLFVFILTEKYERFWLANFITTTTKDSLFADEDFDTIFCKFNI